MASQPCGPRQVELQVSMFDGPMVFFADIAQAKNAHRANWPGISAMLALGRIGRRTHGEPHRVPGAIVILWSPATTAGIAKIAESFENVLCWNLALVAGCGAVAAPSRAQRKSRGVRPRAVLKFLYRHEKGAGQCAFSRRNVGTRHCNQWRRVWPATRRGCSTL
jgi:hypothetical protein